VLAVQTITVSPVMVSSPLESKLSPAEEQASIVPPEIDIVKS
jgi:hypothetical protein